MARFTRLVLWLLVTWSFTLPVGVNLGVSSIRFFVIVLASLLSGWPSGLMSF